MAVLVVIGIAVVSTLCIASGVQAVIGRWWWVPPLRSYKESPHPGRLEGVFRIALGAFFLVIDPMRFAGGPVLAAVVEQMAHTLAAEPGAPRMPGDPERDCEAERRRTGIPVEPQLARQMHDWSQRLGVPPPLRTIAQG